MGAEARRQTSVKNLVAKRRKTQKTIQGQGGEVQSIGDLVWKAARLGGMAAPLRRQAAHVEANYELGDVLGSGNYGVVRECRNRWTGERHACKIVSKKRSSKDLESVRDEVALMRHLAGHPGIVQLVEVCEDEGHVYLVMELCSGGDLFEWLTRVHHFGEADGARILWELVTAVGFCHSRGVLHRDLKPENVLLRHVAARTAASGAAAAAARQERLLRICDFGLATPLERGRTVSGLAGSPYYLAPEVVANAPYGFEADIWSLGVILHILLCGFAPFAGDSEHETFAAIAAGALALDDPEWAAVSDTAQDLVCWMLSPDPLDRPSIQEVLAHPWMHDLLSAAEASPPPPPVARAPWAAPGGGATTPGVPPGAFQFQAFAFSPPAACEQAERLATEFFTPSPLREGLRFASPPHPAPQLPSPATPTFCWGVVRTRPWSLIGEDGTDGAHESHLTGGHGAGPRLGGGSPPAARRPCSRQLSVVTCQLSHQRSDGEGGSPGAKVACSPLRLLDANAWTALAARAAAPGDDASGSRACGYESCLSCEGAAVAAPGGKADRDSGRSPLAQRPEGRSLRRAPRKGRTARRGAVASQLSF